MKVLHSQNIVKYRNIELHVAYNRQSTSARRLCSGVRLFHTKFNKNIPTYMRNNFKQTSYISDGFANFDRVANKSEMLIKQKNQNRNQINPNDALIIDCLIVITFSAGDHLISGTIRVRQCVFHTVWLRHSRHQLIGTKHYIILLFIRLPKCSECNAFLMFYFPNVPLLPIELNGYNGMQMQTWCHRLIVIL